MGLVLSRSTADSQTDWAVPGQQVVQSADLVVVLAEVVLAEAEEAGEVEEVAEVVVEAAAYEQAIRTGEARSTDNSPISGIDAARSSLPIQAQSSSHWRIPH